MPPPIPRRDEIALRQAAAGVYDCNEYYEDLVEIARNEINGQRAMEFVELTDEQAAGLATWIVDEILDFYSVIPLTAVSLSPDELFAKGNPTERAIMLASLFELRMTYLKNDARWDAITALAVKLGGDPGAMFFGADPNGLP